MAEKMHKVIPETYGEMPKKVRYYPTFRLGDDDLPELDGMDVGKKYTLTIEVEVMSKIQGSEYDQTNKSKEIKATFKALKVGLCEPKKAPVKKAETRAEFELRQGRVVNGGNGSRYNSNR